MTAPVDDRPQRKPGFADVFAGAAEAGRKQQHAQEVELFTDMMTVTYDKASAYMNIVTVGGYAAFFGLWSLLGNEIPVRAKFWSALLLGVSVLLFVGFEIVKSVILLWQLRSMRLVTTSTVMSLADRKHDFQKTMKNASWIALGAWCVVFPVSAGTGILGACILLWSFIVKLWSLY